MSQSTYQSDSNVRSESAYVENGPYQPDNRSQPPVTRSKERVSRAPTGEQVRQYLKQEANPGPDQTPEDVEIFGRAVRPEQQPGLAMVARGALELAVYGQQRGNLTDSEETRLRTAKANAVHRRFLWFTIILISCMSYGVMQLFPESPVVLTDLDAPAMYATPAAVHVTAVPVVNLVCKKPAYMFKQPASDPPPPPPVVPKAICPAAMHDVCNYFVSIEQGEAGDQRAVSADDTKINGEHLLFTCPSAGGEWILSPVQCASEATECKVIRFSSKPVDHSFVPCWKVSDTTHVVKQTATYIVRTLSIAAAAQLVVSLFAGGA